MVFCHTWVGLVYSGWVSRERTALEARKARDSTCMATVGGHSAGRGLESNLWVACAVGLRHKQRNWGAEMLLKVDRCVGIDL